MHVVSMPRIDQWSRGGPARHWLITDPQNGNIGFVRCPVFHTRAFCRNQPCWRFLIADDLRQTSNDAHTEATDGKQCHVLAQLAMQLILSVVMDESFQAMLLSCEPSESMIAEALRELDRTSRL